MARANRWSAAITTHLAAAGPRRTSRRQPTATFSTARNPKPLSAGFLDYGARMYDARIGRWFAPDPLTERYYSHSPYHFSGNNPIKFVDLNGMNYTYNDGQYFRADGSVADWDEVQKWMEEPGNGVRIYDAKDKKQQKAEESGMDKFNMASEFFTIGATAMENSSATFRYTNSVGKLDFKYYSNGWKGNQYVSPVKVSNLGRVGGGLLSALNIGFAGVTLFNSDASQFDKGMAKADITFGAMGLTGWAIGGTAGTVLGTTSLGYGVVFAPIFIGTYHTAPAILEAQRNGLYFPHVHVGK